MVASTDYEQMVLHTAKPKKSPSGLGFSKVVPTKCLVHMVMAKEEDERFRELESSDEEQIPSSIEEKQLDLFPLEHVDVRPAILEFKEGG